MKAKPSIVRALRLKIVSAQYEMMTAAGFHIDDLNLPRKAKDIAGEHRNMIRWQQGRCIVALWSDETITVRGLVRKVARSIQSVSMDYVWLRLHRSPKSFINSRSLESVI